MLDGWYCRSIANQNAVEQNDRDDENEPNVVDDSDESQDVPAQHMMPRVDYKSQYHTLKKKLKFLLYENEFFQDALRSSQRRLLKVTRDRSFLLDRLLQYEKPEHTSSDSEETDTSEDEAKVEQPKKRKSHLNDSQNVISTPKRRKQTPRKPIVNHVTGGSPTPTMGSDGHMTAEEVERHLQSRQSLMELVPERAPLSVPNEMFSNEPSLDSESNDQLIETSPSNLGEDCTSIDVMKNEASLVF